MSLATSLTINSIVFTKLFDDPERGAVYQNTATLGISAPILLTVKHERPDPYKQGLAKGTIRHLVSISYPMLDVNDQFQGNRATVNFTVTRPASNEGNTELDTAVKTMLLALATGATAANSFTGQVLNFEL